MKRTRETAERSNAHRVHRGRRVFARSALAGPMLVCMLALVLAGTAIAAETQRPKGTGMLVSVEANGTVIIAEHGHAKEDGSQDSAAERGYLLSPHAVILDFRGKRTSLEKLELPTVVAFEYIFTRQGPEIRLIREMAQ